MAVIDNKRYVYLGIDLAEHHAMVSYMLEGMEEPETISTVVGGDSYKIPYDFTFSQVLEEYLEIEKNEDARTEYFQKWIALFHRILQLRIRLNLDRYEMCLGIALADLDQKKISFLDYTLKQFGISRSRVKYMEYSESFFYFTYHQQPIIWQHQVALFRYAGNELECMILERNGRSVPQQVQMRKVSWTFPDKETAANWKKDTFLSACMQEIFQKHVISGVYLIGDDFNIDWMKESKRLVISNRKAFLGQNLFTKGACYAVALRRDTRWSYTFRTDYKIASTIRIKVRNEGQEIMLPLATEGQNWFECSVSYEFMLRGSAKIDLYQYYGEKNTFQIQSLKLTNLPARPGKTMRLSLEAHAINNRTCRITVRDLGFGDFYNTSGRSWKFDVAMYPKKLSETDSSGKNVKE